MFSPLSLVLAGVGLVAVSGLPGLLLHWRSTAGERLACLLAVAGSLFGLSGALLVFITGSGGAGALRWPLPGAAWSVEVDALGAFFLAPIFLVSGLGSIYGLGYWPQSKHPASGRRLRFFWGTLACGLAILVLARNGILFLFGWEVMALSAFFLVGTEDDKPEVRQASWVYLLAAHVGTLALFAMFALLHNITGTFEFRPIGVHEAGLGTLTIVFTLALVGFGLKAGLMPLHVWLPGAHANAPSHVSAILSGVVLKIGIYGLVRFLGYLPAPPIGWGGLLLVLGVVSGILGVVFALGQHDLKRLLAYHSVENIGIIVMGLGLAMIGRSVGRSDWTVLGLAGCLLHVWNHGLFKSLLFLGAGSVVHATRTREIDRLGGLAKSMPATALLFLVGAVAICGLPPLNGFVSELLIYMGLFRTLGPSGAVASPASALAVPCLAMIGALAVACFVKAYGAVFLGSARDERASRAHESPAPMIGTMVVLAACCAAIGLSPILVAPILDQVVSAWPGSGGSAALKIAEVLPLGWISGIGTGFAALLAIAGALILRRRTRVAVPSVGTWDCGYARPAARMQYTSSSFAQSLVGLFRSVLRPRTHRPSVTGVFPRVERFRSHVDDVVLEGLISPALRRMEHWIERVRVFQHGRAQEYILYVLVALIILLLGIFPIDELMRRIFTR